MPISDVRRRFRSSVEEATQEASFGSLSRAKYLHRSLLGCKLCSKANPTNLLLPKAAFDKAVTGIMAMLQSTLSFRAVVRCSQAQVGRTTLSNHRALPRTGAIQPLIWQALPKRAFKVASRQLRSNPVAVAMAVSARAGQSFRTRLMLSDKLPHGFRRFFGDKGGNAAKETSMYFMCNGPL